MQVIRQCARTFVAAIGLMAATSCNDAHRGVTSPHSGTVGLRINATALLASAATVQVRVAYQQKSGSTVELGRQSVTVAPGAVTFAAQSLSLTFDIAPCLADAQHVVATDRPDGCPTVVELTLFRDASILDQLKRTVVFVRGQNVSWSDAVTLYEIGAVAVKLGGTDLQLNPARAEIGQKVTATAQVVDAKGSAIADRSVTWSTRTPTIVRLSTTTGNTVSVDVIGTGLADLTASSGERSMNLTLTGIPESARQVTVRPADTTVFVGDTVRYSADGKGASGATVAGATFRFDSPAATVSLSAVGVAIARSVGVVTVNATTDAGPRGSSVSGAATLRMVARPTLAASPSSIELGLEEAQRLPSRTVAVTSFGNSALAGLTAEVVGTVPVRATLDRSTTPATLTVAATATLSAGTTARGIVRLRSTTNGVLPLDLPVSVAPLGPSVVVASTNSVDFGTLEPGTTAGPVAVVISAPNGRVLTGLSATVSYGTGSSAGWLDATLDQTSSTPATLSLRARTSGVPAGSYSATVRVAVATPSGSTAAVIAVQIQVLPSATLLILPTTLDLGTIDAGTIAAPSTAAVTGAAGRTISGLLATVSYPSGGVAGWLDATLDKTTTAATLTASARSSTLAAGSYNATVTVSASGGVQPISVTVRLVVRGPAELVALPTQADFGVLDSGSVGGTRPIAISARDGRSISGLAATTSYATGPSTSWVTATISGTTVSITVSTNPLPPGIYTATVTVQAASPIGAVPVRIPVGVRILGDDSLVVNPGQIDFGTINLSSGTTTASRNFSLTSLVGRNVVIYSQYTIEYFDEVYPWLNVVLTGGGVTPTTGRLTADFTQLSSGTYSARVTISSSTPRVRPASIYVTVIVTGGVPAIKVQRLRPAS